MILKLYKDSNKDWSFDFKRKHYLVKSIDIILNGFCNILNKDIIYLKLAFYSNGHPYYGPYYGFVSDWSNDGIYKLETIHGQVICDLFKLVSGTYIGECVIVKILPIYPEHDYIFITEIR